jgi:hypothetical protein
VACVLEVLAQLCLSLKNTQCENIVFIERCPKYGRVCLCLNVPGLRLFVLVTQVVLLQNKGTEVLRE